MLTRNTFGFHCRRLLIFVAVGVEFSCGFSPSVAQAITLINSGHVDVVAIGYQGNQLALGSRADTPAFNTRYAAAEIAVVVPVSTRENRRIGSAYDAIGVSAGTTIYKLAQSSLEATLENAPFVGLAADDVPAGVFVNNLLRFELTAVVGPGHFSIWRETANGPGFESRPGFVGIPIASADGIDENDFFLLPANLHEHENWAFTQPGTYYVSFEVSGQRVPALGSDLLTAHATYRFDVRATDRNPDLNHDATVDRADFALVVQSYGAQSEPGFVAADLDLDGRVGLKDLSILQISWTPPYPASAPTAIPEPAAWAQLSVVTCLGVGAIWRRRFRLR